MLGRLKSSPVAIKLLLLLLPFLLPPPFLLLPFLLAPNRLALIRLPPLLPLLRIGDITTSAVDGRINLPRRTLCDNRWSSPPCPPTVAARCFTFLIGDGITIGFVCRADASSTSFGSTRSSNTYLTIRGSHRDSCSSPPLPLPPLPPPPLLLSFPNILDMGRISSCDSCGCF